MESIDWMAMLARLIQSNQNQQQQIQQQQARHEADLKLQQQQIHQQQQRMDKTMALSEAEVVNALACLRNKSPHVLDTWHKSAARADPPEEINVLQAQMAAVSQEVAESRELADRLLALRAELESVTRSCASLQSTLEVAQANHASLVENAAWLERSLADSTSLVGPLEAKVRDLSERLIRGVEDHVREMEGFLHKQRGLKEQLEASRAAERAAREELLALQGKVKNLKSTLLAASAGLQEQDNSIKGLKEKATPSRSRPRPLTH